MRPKRDVSFDASDEVIRRWFRSSMAARDEQRAASAIISDQNVEMQAEGVEPGVLALMRKIAAMPEGKRGLHLFLVRRYAEVLEEDLADPTFDEPAEAETAAVPFGERRTAA